MIVRDVAKSALQKAGLFPFARLAFRALNPDTRRQREREMRFYSDLLKPDSLCFDVGANLGQKTDIFLACGMRTVTIEPNIRCQPALELQFSKNSRCQLDYSAVGPSEGIMSLYVHGTDATASLIPDWDKLVFGADRGLESISVPVTTMDKLIERYGRPDFIKIDVEGYEAEVLKGISYRPALLSFEYHPNGLGRARECLDYLKRFSPLRVRASDMHGNWIGEETDAETCLVQIERLDVGGDLFVCFL
jgi:FkbM family methyltransferase